MDHSMHNHNHEAMAAPSGGMHMSKMMPMYFGQEDRVTLFFKTLKSETGETGKYVGLLVLTAAIGIIIEAINYCRFKRHALFACQKGAVIGIGFKLT